MKQKNIINNKIINKNHLKKITIVDDSIFEDEIPHSLKFLFKDLNIFDTVLLLLMYNPTIRIYLNKHKDKILSYGNNKPYSLNSIMYYIYEHLWISEQKKLKDEKELIQIYQNFLSNYSKILCNNIKGNFHFNNIENFEIILNFIYSKINEEITEVNKNHLYKGPVLNDNKLSNYLIEFHGKNKSVISDNFNGFYQEISTCLNCKEITEKNSKVYIPNIKYSTFNYLYFNLDDISTCNLNSNIMNSYNANCAINYTNQYNTKLNIYDCFNYQLNKLYQFPCFLCNSNNLNITKKNTFYHQTY